ncbi:hypothetical protein HanXRQr2_Chr13g0591881 [Helianthus annuus]|uniref:Uncharacterized protein n=1 Tax=Helianthus annuus TaxID=4232 RepID=A0A9K3EIK9_HELAN|nr:hypothetical protein HanXRQr2_Chr13g0591881 [Helianthus annuus]KAJ0849554.1 hypothetical protein HanPSC8_Chr13g0570051 [Helianthus annuus]
MQGPKWKSPSSSRREIFHGGFLFFAHGAPGGGVGGSIWALCPCSRSTTGQHKRLGHKPIYIEHMQQLRKKEKI